MSHSKTHPRAQPVLPTLHAVYIKLPPKTKPGAAEKGFTFFCSEFPGIHRTAHTRRAVKSEQPEVPRSVLVGDHG